MATEASTRGAKLAFRGARDDGRCGESDETWFSAEAGAVTTNEKADGGVRSSDGEVSVADDATRAICLG